MKIRPVGAELFHAAKRTDMTKLIIAFRNVANAPKNCTDAQGNKKDMDARSSDKCR